MAVEPLLPTTSAPAEFTAWIEEVSRVLDHQTSGMRIATTVATTDSADFTGTEVVIDSVEAALVEGWTYKIRWVVNFISSVAGDNTRARIREDNLAGGQLALNDVYHDLSSGLYPAHCETEFTATGTGNKTFVTTGQRISGSGNVHAEAAGGTRPRLLYVDYVRED